MKVRGSFHFVGKECQPISLAVLEFPLNCSTTELTILIQEKGKKGAKQLQLHHKKRSDVHRLVVSVCASSFQPWRVEMHSEKPAASRILCVFSVQGSTRLLLLDVLGRVPWRCCHLNSVWKKSFILSGGAFFPGLSKQRHREEGLLGHVQNNKWPGPSKKINATVARNKSRVHIATGMAAQPQRFSL